MKTRTIVVEDRASTIEILVPKMVELAEVEVLDIAETPDGAIELLKIHDAVWTLLVVDLQLAKGTGFSVLRACKTRRPGQHVVVLTNYPSDYVRHYCIALGADAVFDKWTELGPFFDHCRSYRIS